MKEKFVQNIEEPVSIIEFILETQESFDGFFFVWHFTFYDGF